MDRLPRPWHLVLAAPLSLGAGCGFDTAPLHGTSLTGATAQPEAGTGVAGSAGHRASIAPAVSSGAASAAGSAPVIVAAGAGGASGTGTAMAPGAPAVAPAPAGASSPAPARAPTTCDGVGSYGLQITADLAWDSTNGFAEAGRGPAQIFALLDVSHVDPQTGAIAAEAQVCGLALPALQSPFSCGAFELRFADKIWDRRELPRARPMGAYACAADGCKLELAPELTLGIQLDPAQPTWPAAGTTMVAQYPDDDGDGLPGLSADIVTLDSNTSGPGNGNTNGTPGCGYTPFGTAAVGGSDAGRMLLGLRAQLAAAVSLAQDCRVTRASGDLQSLALRAGGCELRAASWTTTGQGNMGMGSMTGNDKSPCSEELRTAMDQGLPSYQVLAAGQAPPSSATSTVRDMSLSQGPQLRAVRFLPGVKPSCEQVRKAVY